MFVFQYDTLRFFVEQTGRGFFSTGPTGPRRSPLRAENPAHGSDVAGLVNCPGDGRKASDVPADALPWVTGAAAHQASTL